MSKPVMYIFVNKGLHMSAGKIGAQAAHAAVEAYKISDSKLVEDWYLGKHYTKLIMEARDASHLEALKYYLSVRGFKSEMIIDEGMTEIDPHIQTALGVEIVDKEDPHTLATFSSFSLYRDTVRVNLEVDI